MVILYGKYIIYKELIIKNNEINKDYYIIFSTNVENMKNKNMIYSYILKRYRRKIMNKRITRRQFLKGVAGSIILLTSTGIFTACKNMKNNQVNQVTNTPVPSSTPNSTPEPTIDSIIEDPIDLISLDSINILINKTHPLPSDYVPEDMIKPNVICKKEDIKLKREAAEAIEEMFDAAKKDGYSLAIGSAYRSYNYQKNLYNNYVKRDGEEAANRYSAKPGQSEHQTGLAADLSREDGYCYLSNCFKDTEEGKWLKENAYLYGFILRYPEGKEEITGYIFEPWHYRYIGKKEALKVYESGLTLEEYYEILD